LGGQTIRIALGFAAILTCDNARLLFLISHQEGFIAYKTSHYKLHFFETLTGLKFVLNSDPGVESLQSALRQIYTQLYVEHVVKNPLASASMNSGNINPETMGSEGFRSGVDRYVRSLTMFDTL
jgi:hypothetical protein